MQHHSNCTTEVLELDSIRQPFYGHCKDGSETRFTDLKDAIQARNENCVVVEEVVDVTNATMETLNQIKSKLGGDCVDNHDCASNSCFENTCCATDTDTTNCVACGIDGECTCLQGSVKINGTCVYDNVTCTTPSYWIDDVGCVNASFGDSCSHDKNCAEGKCYSGTCCKCHLTVPDATGVCSSCISDASLLNGSCVPKLCAINQMFVEDKGCILRPAETLQAQVQDLLMLLVPTVNPFFLCVNIQGLLAI